VVGLLAWQLSGQGPAAATGRTEVYGDSYGGPVIDQWLQLLTEVPAAATATHRVQRLLNGWSADAESPSCRQSWAVAGPWDGAAGRAVAAVA
jgi:hypothetical protein